MALIKNQSEISILRIAGKKLHDVLEMAINAAKQGVSLQELDALIEKSIREAGATPSFLGYDGFPNASCLSLNAQVVHGIPTNYKLQDGDLLGIDVGLWFKGLCVDAARSVVIGTGSADTNKLLKATLEGLKAGIKAAKPFRRIGAISEAVQEVGEKYHLGIVRALTGHGVGHQVHEDPEIPNFGKSSDGIVIKPGMVLAIEPMFTLGGAEVVTEIDGWGVVTADKSLAAHFEQTVVITSRGAEILT